jgi:pimeloyl-ACP methyl ester carboxylesterase
MDRATIERAVELGRTDGELRLNAGRWTGSFTTVVGDEVWTIAFEAGSPTSVTDAGGAVPEPTADAHVVSGSPEAWEALLSSPPPSGSTDFFASAGTGAMTILPPPDDAGRHLALRRFGELLRHAANGTDPAPQVVADRSRHGQHDAAVGRYVHLDLDGLDHRLYYESAGQGIGLLCQHTAGADGRQWRHLLEDRRVTDRFQVVVYDLPYHGKSLPPAGRAWWAEPYVLSQELAMEVPVALAKVLGLDRPVFIGSSVGGMLALDLARHHPDDFRAVIALEGGLHVDIPVDLSDVEAASFTEADPASHAATMMMIMSPTAPETYRQETRLHYAQGAPGVFGGDIHYYAIEHDLRGQADQIDTNRCAVHLLTGEYDFPTVPWTEEAARQIKGSTFAVMEGLGHFPMSEDHDALMLHVLPILDAVADAAARTS